MKTSYSISNIRYIKKDGVYEGAISINSEYINGFDKNKNNYKLENHLVIPAFINAHDHLFGTYYPKIGHPKYEKWLEWDNDLKKDDVYKERTSMQKEDIYLLGCYRHFLCGVLTVSDHIPHVINDDMIDKMPIRVIKNYTLAHEAVSYDLKWGEGIGIEHTRALENNAPFITHIAEGDDKESLQSLNSLIKENALTDHTVLIHGISLSDCDIENIAKMRANIVWCPVSNNFMFRKTGHVKKWLEDGINVSLGTDSPATGAINMFDEMKFASHFYKNIYGEDLSYKILYDMCTTNPANAMRLYNIGKIENNAIADLVVVEDRNYDPYKTAATLTLKDVKIIIQAGKVVYAAEEHKKLIEAFNSRIYTFNVEGEKRYSCYDIKGLIMRIRKILGFAKEIPFLPID